MKCLVDIIGAMDFVEHHLVRDIGIMGRNGVNLRVQDLIMGLIMSSTILKTPKVC
jgi:hypothetical protein